MEHFVKLSGISTDEGIIEKVLQGELTLFEMLIRRHNPVLYKIARGYGFNHQDAEDLIQETHITAYQQLRRFEHRSSYKTWISKIMIHKCLYKLNHGYTKYETPDSERIGEGTTPAFSAPPTETLEKTVMNREFVKALEATLQQLAFPYRSVFVLRELEGFSTAETAELLEISPVNVKVRLNRAKVMLQKQLEQLYTAAELYEFNLVYCDAIVKNVFGRIGSTLPE